MKAAQDDLTEAWVEIGNEDSATYAELLLDDVERFLAEQVEGGAA